jgi:hypothetical protein
MKFKHRIRLLAVMTVAIVAFGIAVPTVEALRAMRGDVVDIEHIFMLSLGSACR